jgi:hypothetical protein
MPVPPHYLNAVFKSAEIHQPATSIAVPGYYKNASGIRELNGDYESTSNSSTLENSVETTTRT